MSNFYNAVVRKKWNDRDDTYIRLGQQRFNQHSDFYGSDEIDEPFPSISRLKLNDYKAKYKYESDYQVFRKHPELVNKEHYELVFIDIENLNGVYYGGYTPIMHTITVCSVAVYPSHELKQLRLIEDFGGDEIAFLSTLLQIISKDNFIISGWNVGYDVQLILDRWRCITGTEPPNILNPIIDYQALYRQYVKDKENSFKLNYILQLHGQAAKVSFDGSFDQLYRNNRPLYYEYNRRDVGGLIDLEDTLHLFKLVTKIREISGCLWQDVISNSRIIESILYKGLSSDGRTFWDNKKRTFVGYEGAFVYDPIPGIYKDLYCFDFASLYPSAIISWNIGPDTLVSSDYHNCKTTPTGTSFSTDRISVIATMEKYLLKCRKPFKEQVKSENLPKSDPVYHTQDAYKRIANSVYGIFGLPGKRFSDERIASTITGCARHINQYVGAAINQASQRLLKRDIIVYGDTDSLYIDASGIKEHHNKSDYIYTFIHSTVLPQYAREHGLLDHQFSMEDEYGKIEGIMVQKKHYIIREPGKAPKFTGFIKTDKPVKANDLFKPLCTAILDGTVTTAAQVTAYKAWVRSNMTTDVEWLKPYRANMKIDQYKTKQRWITGLENLKQFYVYNGDYTRGVVLEMLRQPVGRERTPKDFPVTIPEDLYTFIPSLIKMAAEIGVVLNEEKQFDQVCSNINMLEGVVK